MLEEIDRRERTRHRLREPVTAEWQGKRISGEATELSRDSIFVETASSPPENSSVEITIGAGADAVRLPCRVRRVAGAGFAGEFEMLSPQQRSSLEKLLARLPY